MPSQPQAITTATPGNLASFIQGAASRLVVLAPAVSLDVACAIRERWESLGADRVSVTLDVDAEVYRLGYGQIEGLQLLEQTGAQLGTMLQQHRGIRIGVVIADERVLVYTPIPELIEAGPRNSEAPNAVILATTPRSLEEDLGIGQQGRMNQEVGLDKASRSEIEVVQSDLKRNPPQSFDVVRRLQVFNAAFRFVELEMLGTQMSRRTVQVPTHLFGVLNAETATRLRTLLQIVPTDHKLAGRPLQKLRKRITDRHLHSIAGHGTVVLRSEEKGFLEGVSLLRVAVEAFRETVVAELGLELANRVTELTAMLSPVLFVKPPLREWGLAGPLSDLEETKKWVREDLEKSVGRAEDYVSDMEVRVAFKEVTLESLQDPKFMSAARAAFSEREVPQLYQEFAAAPAGASKQRPF